MQARAALLLAPAAAVLCGCHAEHSQSVLHPAGPAAARIAWLWWFMFAVLTVVFIITMALMLAAVLRRASGERGGSPLGDRFVIVSGILLPAVVLVVLLFLSLEASIALNAPAQGLNPDPAFLEDADEPLTIEVIGHQWWWEVVYPRQAAVAEEIITANELYIPVGRPVRLKLWSVDVIHSFWVPNLNGKMDMLPERTNTLWIQADRAGEYRGQCAEFCGLQHALMAFVVVAVEPPAFEAWVEDRQRPHPEPQTDELRRGQEVFFLAKCDACHRVRGAEYQGRPAQARVGPDLTHMGTRRTVAAGWLPNTHGNLAGWIFNPQALKPGNRMPETFLSGPEFNASEDIHALTSWLRSLP